jgi:hypothetical protein
MVEQQRSEHYASVLRKLVVARRHYIKCHFFLRVLIKFLLTAPPMALPVPVFFEVPNWRVRLRWHAIRFWFENPTNVLMVIPASRHELDQQPMAAWSLISNPPQKTI